MDGGQKDKNEKKKKKRDGYWQVVKIFFVAKLLLMESLFEVVTIYLFLSVK
jgi:hypothetical protein